MTIVAAPARRARFWLVAIDLDGTLLPSSGSTVSARTARSLRRVQATGAAIVLASARPPQSIEQIATTLGLTGALIAYNGALCYEPASGHVIFEAALTPAVGQSVIAIGRTIGLHVSLYVDRRWMVERLDEAAQQEAAASGLQPRVVRDLLPVARHGAHKVLLIGPQSLLDRAAREISACCPDAYAVRSKPRYLEVTSLAVSKGTGLQAVAVQYGVPRAQILAIGDGRNDIPLFAAAGYAVAMGNAAAQVRARADLVAPTNDDDGVAWALDRLVSLEENAENSHVCD